MDTSLSVLVRVGEALWERTEGNFFESVSLGSSYFIGSSFLVLRVRLLSVYILFFSALSLLSIIFFPGKDFLDLDFPNINLLRSNPSIKA